MWEHKSIYSTIAYYAGLAALISLFISGSFLVYLPYIIILYFLGSITISVGYHRLFCHSAFKTSKLFHKLFAFFGVLFQFSSPLQWAVIHASHHKYSDTNNDPHYPKPWSLFLRKYRTVPLNAFKIKRLLRNGHYHFIIYKYYQLIYLCILLALLAISPSFILCVYLPVLGLLHLVGSIHTTFSHWNDNPRDLAFMEFLLPASGEWLHGHHHDYPRNASFRSKWWHFDLGAIVIKLIKTN